VRTSLPVELPLDATPYWLRGRAGLAAGSTVVEKNLDRITVAAAVAWVFTTMILGIRYQ